MLGPQQTDDAQIKRLLNWRQTPLEFLEAGGEEFGSLTRPVGVHVLRQQQEQQLRVLRKPDAVDRFEVFKVGQASRGRMRFFSATPHEQKTSHREYEQSDQQQCN